MRPFPKEIVSRIPPRALEHTGIYSLISGLTVLYVGYTNEGETIGSCLRTALDGELLVANPVTGILTLIDAELITHVAFSVMPRPKHSVRNRLAKNTINNAKGNRPKLPKGDTPLDFFATTALSWNHLSN